MFEFWYYAWVEDLFFIFKNFSDVLTFNTLMLPLLAFAYPATILFISNYNSNYQDQTSNIYSLQLDLVYATIFTAPFNRGSLVQAVFLTWLSLPVQTAIFWFFFPFICTSLIQKIFDPVMSNYFIFELHPPVTADLQTFVVTYFINPLLWLLLWPVYLAL